MAAIVGPCELFIVNGVGGEGLSDALDVGDGMRTFTQESYIHLLAGSWMARVVLGFSPEAAGHTFYVDAYWGGQRALAERSFQPMKAGVYTLVEQI